MDGGKPPSAVPGEGTEAGSGQWDMQALARDWIDLWQSELAALAADREAQECWVALAGLWAAAANAMIDASPIRPPTLPYRGARGNDGTRAAPGRDRRRAARSDDAPWSAPTDAASDARDAEIERLARRLAELERRLGPAGGDPA